jgi:hypothetical protein
MKTRSVELIQKILKKQKGKEDNMSHFVVVIIGDDVEGQLKPYQENNMGDCPKEYMEFNDREDEMLKDYQTGSTEKVRTPEGELLWSWDERFRVKGQMGTGTGTHKVPDDCEKVELAYTELYPTFEDYASDYEGYKKRDEEMGRFGYWENPNAKWDYWRVGGRWGGYFPVLPNGTALSKPESGWDSPKDLGVNTADQLRKRDVDFERARDEAEAMARKEFVMWRVAFEECGEAESWESTRNRICGEGDDYDYGKIDEAREFYKNQAAIKKLTELDKDRRWLFDNPVSTMGYDEEAYVQRCRNRALVPFAVVKDGKWYEKAEMGWWAVTHNDTMSQEVWNKNFQKLMDSLSDDTLLTVVDCHI